MSRLKRVAVVGGSGYIGGHVVEALERWGAAPIRVPAARVDDDESILAMRTAVRDVDVIVNAAGVPSASSSGTTTLQWANETLPGILADLATDRGIRFVHISSAAVLGRGTINSDVDTSPFSPYSRTKAQGEKNALRWRRTVVYRPPGVHSVDREVTQSLARLARSYFSSVAYPGTAQTPQTLAENVASAVAFLCTVSDDPPQVVHHPAEEVNVTDILKGLGGRTPAQLPEPVVKGALFTLSVTSRLSPKLAAMHRRLEVLWCGQAIAPSWLTSAGWSPPLGRGAWRELGLALDPSRSPRKEILFGVTSGVSAPPFFEGMFPFLVARGWSVNLLSTTDGNVIDFAKANEAKHIPISAVRTPSPLTDLRTLVTVTATLRRLRPRVAVWGTPKMGLLGVVACRLSGTRSIYTVHGLRYQGAFGWKKRVLKLIEATSCRLATQVVAVGFDIADCLVSDSLVQPSRVAVLANGSANGVEEARYSGAVTRNGGPIEATFVGRLTRDKGLVELLDAWQVVRAHDPGAILHLYGRREEDASSAPIARRLSSEGIVEHGHVASTRQVYENARILLLPTYREGVPTVVLEAAAAGVPSIVSDVPGAREPIVPGVTGVLIPAKDHMALATEIVELSRDDSRRVTMGRAARSHVLTRYDRTKLHRAWVDLIELIAG